MSEKILFIKMHNAGNDYVYIDHDFYQPDDPSALSIKLSHRRFGVGSDGLILIVPSTKADVKMIMYNADGSYSKMCGNGLLSLSKYVFDAKKIDKDQFTVESGDNIYDVKIIKKEDTLASRVQITLPPPIFDGVKIPSVFDEAELINHQFTFDNELQFKGTLISMGNPHIVIFTDHVDQIDLEAIGPVIELHPFFPERINVEFVEVLDNHTIKQRTWERGSGETWACASGAAAASCAAILNGYAKKSVTVQLLGGTLDFSWEGRGQKIAMQGSPKLVFKGIINI